MSHLYRPPESKSPWTSLLLGLVAAGVLFVLISLSQVFSPGVQPASEVEEVNFAPPLPPTPPVDEMMQIFEFSDLDEVPRVTRQCRFRYPLRFKRSKGTGFVRLLILINPDGRVSVQEVVDASHPEFVPAVEACAEATRFSIPMRNGKAVRAKYKWKIEFPLGE